MSVVAVTPARRFGEYRLVGVAIPILRQHHILTTFSVELDTTKYIHKYLAGDKYICTATA